MVEEIERRIRRATQAAVTGAVSRATRTRRPRPRDIDWNKTIAANLSRYQPEYKTVIPEQLIGYGRRQQVVARDIILAIDQSGSMASSVVYASVFGAVLASIRAVRTSLVVFDTAVVDLTEKLADPVDVLFGAQLGGGTDINQALAYAQTLITRPRDTVLRAHLRPVRGRRRGPDAGQGGRDEGGRGPGGGPAGAVRRRRARLRLGQRRGAGRAGRARRSPAPRTRSPTCWRWPSPAATSAPGPTAPSWPAASGINVGRAPAGRRARPRAGAGRRPRRGSEARPPGQPGCDR